MQNNWIQFIRNDSPFAKHSYLILSDLFRDLEANDAPSYLDFTHPIEAAYRQLSENTFDADEYKRALTEKRDLMVSLGSGTESIADPVLSNKEFFQRLKRTISPKEDSDLPLTDSQISRIVENAKNEWDALNDELLRAFNDCDTREHKDQAENALSRLIELGLVKESEGRMGGLVYSLTSQGIYLFKDHVEKHWNGTNELPFGRNFPVLLLLSSFAREIRGNVVWDIIKVGVGAAGVPLSA